MTTKIPAGLRAKLLAGDVPEFERFIRRMSYEPWDDGFRDFSRHADFGEAPFIYADDAIAEFAKVVGEDAWAALVAGEQAAAVAA